MFAQNNNKSVIVTSNNYAYSFDDAVRITTDGTGQHGALICTNDTASIYGFYDAQYGGEGFLAIPAKYQSTKYVISSFTIVSGYYTSKSIVHIMLKSGKGPITVDNVNYSINSSITIVLNPTDAFSFRIHMI